LSLSDLAVTKSLRVCSAFYDMHVIKRILSQSVADPETENKGGRIRDKIWGENFFSKILMQK